MSFAQRMDKEISPFALYVHICPWVSTYDLMLLNTLNSNERNMLPRGDSFHLM